jgi:hypothetical protein
MRAKDTPFTTPAAAGLLPEDREPREPWMREWRSPGGVAVGMNDDGSVDELLGPYRFHVEQMDDDYYWASFGDLHVHFAYQPPKRCVLVLGWVEHD